MKTIPPQNMIRRLSRRFTISELARGLGVHRATVHRWLRGNKPIPAARARIEKLYRLNFARKDRK